MAVLEQYFAPWKWRVFFLWPLKNEAEIISRIDKITSLSLFAGFLLLFVTLYFAIERWILSPVRMLKTATEKVTQTKTNVVIPFQSEDEVGELARNVEQLIRSLTSSHNEIVNWHDELENRVDVRMKMLNRTNEMLQRSENRYRLMIQEMLSGFALHQIITDDNGKPIDYRFLSVNKSFCEMTSTTEGDVIGKTVLELFPTTEAVWIERYGHVAITGNPMVFEEYAQALDKYFRCSAYSPMKMHFVVIFQDVTQEKKANFNNLKYLKQQKQLNVQKQALLEANQEVLTNPVFKEVCESVLNKVKGLLRVRMGYVTLKSENDRGHSPVCFDAATFDDSFSLPLPIMGLQEEVYKTKKPLFKNHITDEDWQKIMPEGQVPSDNLLLVPLLLDKEVVGIMGLFAKYGEFDLEDVKLASAFGDLISTSYMRHQAMGLLKESEERYRSLVGNAQDAIITLNKNGEVTSWNRGAEFTFEYDTEEILGLGFERLIEKDYLPKWHKALTRVRRELNSTSGRFIEIIGQKQDGSLFPLEISLSPWVSQGELFLTAIIRDVSERMKMQQSLDESHRIYQHLFDNAHDAIFMLEVDGENAGKIVAANRAAATIHGYEYDELLKLNIQDLDGESDVKLSSSRIEHLKRGENLHVELEHLTKGGQKIQMEVRAQLIEYEGKRYILSFDRDISVQKRIEEEKAEMQAQLIQSVKLASLGTMASSVAHELKNPLTAVLGHAVMLTKHSEDVAKVEDRSEKIRLSSMRMKSIVDHLRVFARDSKDEDWKQLDFNGVVNESLLFLEMQLKYANVNLKVMLQDNLPLIWGDSTQLNSALQNFLVNSIDAFEELTDNRERHISIHTVQNEDNGITLVYKDNAGGIPSEVQDKIFLPFFTTKESGKGTGLGMSITKEILGNHRATLTLDSEEGVGTTFVFNFPSDRRAGKRLDKGVDSSETINLQKVAQGDKPTLLIIDDEEDVSEIFADFVEDYFSIQIVNNPVLALEKIELEKFDLIVSDYKMPRVTGLQILFKVKEFQASTPVFIMTGMAEDEEEIVHLKEKGVWGILAKPFTDPDELVARLQEALKSDDEIGGTDKVLKLKA